MLDVPPPIQILAPGPDRTWYCSATIAVNATDRSRKRGQRQCGWRTGDVHPSQVQELLDLCDQHNATSAQRRDEYLRSRPPSNRTLEELDAEIADGLAEIRGIADEMEQRYG